jgi:hypothetical protein
VKEQKDKKAKKSPVIRVVKWVAVFGVVLILLLIFILPMVVSSESGRKFILARINPVIEGQVDFSDLSMGWRKGIILKDFRFGDEAQGIAVSVKRVSTRPYYGALLAGNLRLGETIIDTPDIEITLPEPSEQEASKTQGSGKNKSSSTTPSLGEIDLVVKNGHLKVSQAKAERVELAKINVKLHLKSLGQRSDFDLSLEVIHQEKASKIRAVGEITPDKKAGWSLDGLSGNLDIEVDRLDLNALEPLLALAGHEIETQGHLSVQLKSKIEKGQLNNLAGKISGEALEVSLANGQGDRFSGEALEIELETLDQNGKKILSGQASLVGLQGHFKKKDFAISEPVKARVQAGLDESGINVNLLEVTSGFGKIHCTGTRKHLDYDAQINLARLQKQLGAFIETGSYSAAGELLSKGSLSFEDKQGVHLASDATEIKHLKIVKEGQEPFEQEHLALTFDAKINPDEQNIELQIISSQMKIQGNVTQQIGEATTQLKGRVNCEYDWQEVMAAAGPYVPEGLSLEGKQKDQLHFSSTFPTDQPDELVANLESKIKLGFAQAHYMGLDFEATELNLQVDKGLLDIEPLTTTVNGGQINLAGQADLSQEPPFFKISKPIDLIKDVQINQETTEKLLTYMNPIFADAINVKGVANLHCEKLAIPLGQKKGSHPEMIGTLSITQMQMQASDLLGQILAVTGTSPHGQNMTIHPTRFILRNGSLSYDDMQIDIGNTPIHFKGTIGIEDKRLAMTVTLPYSQKGRTSNIVLPLRGTITKPELDLEKLLEHQLEDQLKKQLGDYLKDDELGEKVLEGLGELFK